MSIFDKTVVNMIKTANKVQEKVEARRALSVRLRKPGNALQKWRHSAPKSLSLPLV